MFAGILGACNPARALVPPVRRHARKVVIVDGLMMQTRVVNAECRWSEVDEEWSQKDGRMALFVAKTDDALAVFNDDESKHGICVQFSPPS
jgi:hypothetical protein